MGVWFWFYKLKSEENLECIIEFKFPNWLLSKSIEQGVSKELKEKTHLPEWIKVIAGKWPMTHLILKSFNVWKKCFLGFSENFKNA